MKKLLALLMIWLLLPIAGAEEAYTMQDGSLILLDGAGRKCQPIAMKPDFPEALLADADISSVPANFEPGEAAVFTSEAELLPALRILHSHFFG